MPRSKKNWEAWFKKRDAKNLARQKALGERATEQRAKPKRSLSSGFCYARVVGEPQPFSNRPSLSHIQKFANSRRSSPTPAERELDLILMNLNGGVLKGRYFREHIVSGKWIVDFFIPEIRLAIEVDGSIHNIKIQKERDCMKDQDCARFDITMLRISSEQVFGDRDELLKILREGWRRAKRRENQVIGVRSPLPKSR